MMPRAAFYKLKWFRFLMAGCLTIIIIYIGFGLYVHYANQKLSYYVLSKDCSNPEMDLCTFEFKPNMFELKRLAKDKKITFPKALDEMIMTVLVQAYNCHKTEIEEIYGKYTDTILVRGACRKNK